MEYLNIELTKAESNELLSCDMVVIDRDGVKYIIVYNTDEDSYYIGELLKSVSFSINA